MSFIDTSDVVAILQAFLPKRVYRANWTGAPTASEVASAELSGLMEKSDIDRAGNLRRGV